MGHTGNETLQGKLFFALLGNSDELLRTVKRRLALDFSEIAHESTVIDSGDKSPLPGGGVGLRRMWIATTLPVHLSELVEIKRFTGRLERSFAASGTGEPQIEPGYVTAFKVVRVASDDGEHRVFLSSGAYGEPVLRFIEDTRPEGWPWTPADYLTQSANDFFVKTRQLLAEAEITEPVQKA